MTEKLNVVFLDRGTFPGHVELPPFSFPHSLTTYEHTSPDEVPERIANADIVIVNKVRIGAEVQHPARKLRIIGVAATGTDVIDKVAAEKLGIAVVNVRDYAANSVPEHVLALILALRRSIKAYHDTVAKGGWARARHFCFHDYPIRDLAGANLAIVGRGSLGQSVGRLGAAIGMNVSYAARRGVERAPEGYVTFERMLREADVISLNCPLTPETTGLLGSAEFAKMERRPLIINTARGALIDETALVAALDSGQISGVGLDVLRQEPPRPDDPLVALASRRNVLITPHIAWASEEAMRTLVTQLVATIEKALETMPARSWS